MSLSLRCPNCGAEVGISDSKDNYQEKYFYKGDKGQPICNNCGAGVFSQFYGLKAALILFATIVGSILICYGIVELFKYLFK